MNKVSWNTPTDRETVCKRAAGRRRYNARRGMQKLVRRMQILNLLSERSLFDHGLRTRLARELGLSVSTISRDLKALFYTHAICPACGSLVQADRLNRRKG